MVFFRFRAESNRVEVGTGCCVLFDGVTRPWDSWRPADAVAAPLAPDSPVDLRTGYAEDNPVIHLQSCSHDTVHKSTFAALPDSLVDTHTGTTSAWAA